MLFLSARVICASDPKRKVVTCLGCIQREVKYRLLFVYIIDHTHSIMLFTYYNENDRALMELALQVVGLKMTGKVEDAREIAMRIVQGGNKSNG
ncbi:hypothetical protein K492DRAFT_129222, partial [Lichtheimia hyalospora FSU 10163]